jgi:uncharacterized protein YigE (DUF2233 family)
MLVINGKINERVTDMVTNRVRRNAVCINKAGQLVLSVSIQKVAMAEYSYHLLGIGCNQALYMDGSVSSISVHDGELNIGRWNVGPLMAVIERK